MNTLSQHIKHRLLFIRLALLGSLMLVTSAAMAQGGGSTPHVTIGGSVFGGGNLANVEGNSTVIIDQANATMTDVYGGGALANVGTSADDTTTVNILQGHISGNVYGGGLGDSTATGYDGNANVAALVHGKVFVNIGAAPVAPNTNPTGNAIINGSVFGCNNINGTPLDSVFVNIYKTAHTTENTYPTAPSGGWTAATLEANYATPQEYALTAVYGGGNKASYKPSVANRATTVHIYYCSENTIETAYGGGNAANVGTPSKHANTRLIIDGGCYDRIFGGGNGYSATGNHDTPSAPNYNPGANIYGTATTEIHAGLFKQVFGGSNQYGSINTVNLSIDKDPNCDQMILESFCGGNEANMVGTDINATVHCSDNNIGALYGGSNKAHILKDGSGNGGNVTLTVLGGNYDYVFGGSKGVAGTPANIEGNVTLNLHGGTIHEAAFGGSDVSGNILGNISVYVLDTVTSCPLTVDTIYGGGRDAAYTPTNANTVSPTVNVQHCTIKSVFGGGKGSTAVVTANPMVIIGETSTINGPDGQPINTLATVTGDVYGGGDAANVNGTTTVLVQKCNSIAKYVYGGGNAAHVNGTQVYIRGGEIDTIFGGGHGSITHSVAANVNGNDTIAITGGKVGKAFAGSNLNGTISGRMSLNVAKSDPATCDLKVGEVYGGGNQAAGKAGTITIGCTGAWTTTGTNNHTNHNTTNNRIGYELEGVGTVYGGANQADIGTNGNPSNIVLTIKEGIVENVYGGNNTSGDIYGTIQVNIDSLGTCGTNHWYVGNVYGGGNQAPYDGTPDVNILHGTVSGSVYGGGNMAGVSGGDVAMSGGTVLTGIYGGCNTSGTVTGNTVVSITGGTIGADGSGANVHGGGYGYQTETEGNVNVTINGATTIIWGDVYGGSALGNVNNASTDQTNVTLTSGTIHGNLYGGGLGDNSHAAAVNGAVQVTVNGGTVDGSVYGCNNANGAPQSSVKVDIYNTDIPASGYALGNVFGGGNQAAYTYGNGYPKVTVHNCNNSIEYVYGGGNAAAVASTDVKIYGGNTIGYVFGGGNGAGVASNFEMVSGNAVTNIYGGTILHVFAGNNTSGVITGSAILNVDKTAESGQSSCPMYIGEVYGGGNFAAGKVGIINIGCTGDLVALGSGEHYGVDKEGIHYVYGGANQANISDNILLNINSGIVENVFGGNNQSGTISGTITVNIDSTGTCGWYVGNVYGGGNQATYGTANSNYPQVNISNGLVSGDVFGGGLGSSGTAGQVTGNPQVVVNGAKARVNGGIYGGGSLAPTVGNPVVTLTNGALTNMYGGGKAADVSGAPTVNINGGTVSTGIYGGCDSQGNVSGNITVNVKSGSTGNVFGGGFGPSTTTSGNVEINIDSLTNIPAPIIYGDVYGGSAFGTVNNEATDETSVNIHAGYITGDVYGGGLGESGNDVKGTVNGVVTVNVGTGTVNSTTGFAVTTEGYAIIGGSVYGGNNSGGSPQDDVYVNIWKAGATIANVFGGSNAADYAPENGSTTTTKKARVHIYGCDNIIYRVFGGGNAAASPSVETFIEGGTFDQVFGGGNGELGPSYGADIHGTVDLGIHGGNVGQFFGGSNQNGTISGAINVVVDNTSGCGSLVIDEFFCGGNFVDITGDLETDILCSEGMVVNNLYGGCNQANISGDVVLNVYGGIYTNVFGGSKGLKADASAVPPVSAHPANIEGSVTLNLFGGTMENVFGGSNENGNIKGGIVVNVLDIMDTQCPLNITNIYGGSNLTDYTPTNSAITSPIVNIVHIKNGIRGNVYGGSKGAVGVATPTLLRANPQVNVGYDASMNTYIPSTGSNAYTVPSAPRAIISGDVFGGGDAATVEGNTIIFLRDRSKVFGNIYGGGNMGEVEGNTKVIVNGENQ